MLKIECVLHKGSSKMDFYSVSYFKELLGENPSMLLDEKVYGYGKEYTDAGTFQRYVTLDLRKFISEMSNRSSDWAETKESSYADFEISNPEVPSELIQISKNEYLHDTTYQEYWLSYYNDNTPNYINPQTDDDMAPIGLTKTTYNPIVGDDYQFDSNKTIFDERYTLPICNGLLCYPKLINRCLYATGGGALYADPSKRNRNAVLIDFSRVGGCTFAPMSECYGTMSDLTLPCSFDSNTQSLIVVLDGRIVNPDDYNVVSNHISFIRQPIYPLSIMDKQVCCGACVDNYRETLTAEVDYDTLLKSIYSFVIVVNKPNLQIVKHLMWSSTKEPLLSQGENSYSSLSTHQFNQKARGLLFDTRTKSVYDYAREEHTVTFYTDADGEISWKSSTTSINREMPLILFGGTRNNFMSAKGSLFVKASRVTNEDIIAWPEFVILDFVFRG